VTTRGIALAVGLAVPAAWLLWAERLDAGWQPVLATAGRWWLAALQATWRVWLPAGLAAVALWLALPPRPPRRRGGRTPAPPEATDEGVAGRPAPSDWPDPARLSLADWRVRSRTPEGAAALAAAQAAARSAGAGRPESAAATRDAAGDGGGSDPAPTPGAGRRTRRTRRTRTRRTRLSRRPRPRKRPRSRPRRRPGPWFLGRFLPRRAPSGRRSPRSTRRTRRARRTMPPPDPAGRASSNFPLGTLLVWCIWLGDAPRGTVFPAGSCR
jgi:hypothetical protein